MKIHRTLRLPLLFVLLLATLAISGTGQQGPLRERNVPKEKTQPPEQELPPSAEPERRQSRLDLARLDRSAQEPILVDIFAGKSWYVQPPPPPAPKPSMNVPSAPIAPALPFTYAGRLAYPEGKLIIYLTKADTVYAVSAGDIVDSDYRLEAVSDAELVFLYVPLKTQQTLSLSPR